MSDLPDPFTPPDCDLRGFPYMPLLVSRLRRSKAWLMAKRQPELGFYMMNLWTGSWHEYPAASLEDDNDVLADMAMCTPARWEKCRDAAMHGWVKCSDGRWYHPVVAEQAIEAWDRKGKRSEAGRKGNAMRWGSQTDRNAIADQSPRIAIDKERKEKDKKETSLRDAKKENPKATRLPDDWNPGTEGAAFATGLGLNAEKVFAVFRDYWRAKPGAAGVKLDWPATWRNWCRKQSDDNGDLPLSNGSSGVRMHEVPATPTNPLGIRTSTNRSDW